MTDDLFSICRDLNLTMSSTKRVLMYVTPVMLVSFCLNIPKFMEIKSTQDNVTGDHSVQTSDLRLNPTYMLYYTISQIFHPTMTTAIIPMVALIFMNTSIFFGELLFRGIYSWVSFFREMTHHQALRGFHQLN